MPKRSSKKKRPRIVVKTKLTRKPKKTEIDAALKKAKKGAIAAIKQVWIDSAPIVLNGAKNPSKNKEALAFAIKCARTYIELTSKELSYIAKQNHPEEDIILLANLRSRIGDVDGNIEDRKRYFMAAQNVIHMWDALPNDHYHHKAKCVDIELLNQELALLGNKMRESLKCSPEPNPENNYSVLPRGYPSINEQRNRAMANLKYMIEAVGLTAKAMKDLKTGGDSGHALDRLQTSISDEAETFKSQGIADLMAEIDEIEQKENPENEAGSDDRLSPIEEAFINEPFAEAENE